MSGCTEDADTARAKRAASAEARAVLAQRSSAATASASYMCNCRYTRNFFVRSVGANGDHFEYEGDDTQFRRRHAAALVANGASVDVVLADVKAQLEERRKQPAEAIERTALLAERYTRLRPEVYTLDRERFLMPEFHELVAALRACSSGPLAVRQCASELEARGILVKVKPMLWTFPLFTGSFCDALEAEIAHFEASEVPKARPNTMNRYGVILRELGLCPGLLDPLVYDFVDPIATKLIPAHTEGLDSYRAFTVKYDAAEGGDRALSQHYDNAEITLNVNIGGEWTGGQVSFFGIVGEREEPVTPVTLRRGYAVLHAGRELHQAEPVLSGKRQNLILWCRSSGVRNDQCPMCFEPPKVIATNEHMHEGFTVPPCTVRPPAAM